MGRILGWITFFLLIAGLITGFSVCKALVDAPSVAGHSDDPARPIDHVLEDDSVTDKQATFDPALVDRRPYGEWLVNQSEALLSLNVDLILHEDEMSLLDLYPSYAAAVAAARRLEKDNYVILPSVNMLDGKAKQFDDGLYA